MAFLRLSARNSFSSIGPSTGRTMTARFSAALMFKASLGLAMVTRPAPARSAPRAASRAAPVDDGPPEMTTAWPREYLWPSVLACGNAFRQSAGTFANVAGLILSRTRSGIPISATSTTPQCRRPGRRKCPGLRRKNVTVSFALMAASHHRSGGAIHAARQIDGDDGYRSGIHQIDDVARRTLNIPVKSRTKQCIDDQVAVRKCCGRRLAYGSVPALCGQSGVTFQPLAFPNEANAHHQATLGQIARSNEAVAAIVTGARDDHDATPLRHSGGSVGNGPAGILH